MAISQNIYRNICTICGGSYIARRKDKEYCSTKCQNKHFNSKAQRLSLKLSVEQREVILALQDYFLRNQ